MRLLLRSLFGICVALLVGPAATGQGSAANNGAPASPAASHRWVGPDGQPLPFENDDQVTEFLRKASVGKAKGTGRGVTQPRKVALERNGIHANAIFHDVNEERRTLQLRNETIMHFRDSYLFQIAAYELSKLVGLNNVPPSVKRTVSANTGSMTMWIEGVITEEMRLAQHREPVGADAAYLHRQLAVMRVWDALIYNFDRNQGNILLDEHWNVWFIDHTRAFRLGDHLRGVDQITSCERGFFERLRALKKEDVERHLKGYLRPPEITYLMKRRDKLVAHIEQLVRQNGEDMVFFTLH